MPPGIIAFFSGQDPIPTGLVAGFLPETPHGKPRWKPRPSAIMLTKDARHRGIVHDPIIGFGSERLERIGGSD
jgi:hypothetical protein